MNDKSEFSRGERQVLDWIGGERQSMVALLARVVNIDSGSYNKAGVDRVGDAICDFLQQNRIGYRTIPNVRFGSAIRAAIGNPGDSNILLMGHRDTVFADGEAARRPFRAEGNCGYGPGVADMKAGLVMNCFVAAALQKFGGAPAPIVVLFTADEEIGSPSSRALIEQEARCARLVFNAEPGRPGNAIVTGRKGCAFLRFKIDGKAAHAGSNIEDGASAILEMAHKVVSLQKLIDLENGITVNVGIVHGGQTVNTVAPSASGELDLRYKVPADRDLMMTKIEAVMVGSTVPRTNTTFEIYAEFPPLTQNETSTRLFDLYAASARSLGPAITTIFAGGGSDAGFSAAAGAPTLCGVGPVGFGFHSPDEYVELDSLVPRAQALALTIMRSGASFF